MVVGCCCPPTRALATFANEFDLRIGFALTRAEEGNVVDAIVGCGEGEKLAAIKLAAFTNEFDFLMLPLLSLALGRLNCRPRTFCVGEVGGE